jgi:hypothetical protein
MSTKNTSRAVLVLVIALVAALLLYLSFAGRAANSRPQAQDEFPTEQAPPST